ncbi:hypothetical protein BCR42DRAFT_414531 [Absidia repens]|uniref:Uncharacterized protein n=1 Tax=Absidia repens TaxID=90262 RepID=A0A1X2IJ42_9FUNG|nr:hypothetical protein BCR42DRAFT_414531 [Absidia repens]
MRRVPFVFIMSCASDPFLPSPFWCHWRGYVVLIVVSLSVNKGYLKMYYTLIIVAGLNSRKRERVFRQMIYR